MAQNSQSIPKQYFIFPPFYETFPYHDRWRLMQHCQGHLYIGFHQRVGMKLSLNEFCRLSGVSSLTLRFLLVGRGKYPRLRHGRLDWLRPRCNRRRLLLLRVGFSLKARIQVVTGILWIACLWTRKSCALVRLLSVVCILSSFLVIALLRFLIPLWWIICS